MPAYEIYFRCGECTADHPLHLRIHLDNGPEQKQSLAQFLFDRSILPQLMPLRGRKVFCLKTGRVFKLENDDQIFLVPFLVQLPTDEK
jgi:hypothetical protein